MVLDDAIDDFLLYIYLSHLTLQFGFKICLATGYQFYKYNVKWTGIIVLNICTVLSQYRGESSAIFRLFGIDQIFDRNLLCQFFLIKHFFN